MTVNMTGTLHDLRDCIRVSRKIDYGNDLYSVILTNFMSDDEDDEIELPVSKTTYDALKPGYRYKLTFKTVEG